MCDPVTCEKCRNVAGGKEAQTAEGAFDNTPQQVERLALFQKFQGTASEAPSAGPLRLENDRLRESVERLHQQLGHLSELNDSLMKNNRHLKQLLQAIHSTAEAGL